MSYPLHVAFVWHQHQPIYKSPIAGHYRLPWVRLHGIKDYLDLILLLEKYPKIHQTINLAPSLLVQIEDYVAGKAFDPYLELLLTPVETMTPDQLEFIVDRFFDAHFPTLIEPHPRYHELYQQREQQGHNWCLHYWTPQDYSDLLAWHNLAWFDPIYHEDPEIQGWLRQQRGFTLSMRQRIYMKQQQILSCIIPQHNKMQQTGQIEIATSPYTHPILPLLASNRSARVARPSLPLPRYGFHWTDDVVQQLRKAKAAYLNYFHTEPRGLWPSEQSVSPTILSSIIQQGFRWLISDESILGWSLGQVFSRDEQGYVQEPERLYQPYRIEVEVGEIAMVFRDHRLSDLIGFSYSTMDPNSAAKDLIEHLETIRNRLPQTKPWLVTIALDGENCWEYYPQDGRQFLENLYGRLNQHPVIKLVTVSEYLAQFPPTETLIADQLHSGSWIEADFTTWIGDPVKNRAWELLAQARQLIENHPHANEATWESLWAAEGSDWFWWFGLGHSSAHDAIFDQLFREHLESIYRHLGEAVPAILLHPLEDHDGLEDRLPQGFIHPTVNGQPTDREWSQAGRILVGPARGTMHRVSPIRQLWYGFDHYQFYLRFDFSSAVQRPQQLRICWFYPHRITVNSPLNLQRVPNEAPLNYHYRHVLQISINNGSLTMPHQCQAQLMQAGDHHTWHDIPSQIKVALDSCLEISIPWTDLSIEPGQDLQFVALVVESDVLREAIPVKATIALKVP